MSIFLPKDGYLLFQLAVTRQRQETFWENVESKKKKLVGKMATSKDSFERMIAAYENWNPSPIFPYDDVAGYYEIFLSGLDILLNSFFKGDRRTKYGRLVKLHHFNQNISPNRFYACEINWRLCGLFPRDGLDAMRSRLKDALLQVEEKAKRLNCTVEVTTAMTIAERLDLNRLIDPRKL